LNFHLERAESEKRVKNFGNDVKDAEAYTIVLHQLDEKCDDSGLKDKDVNKRMKKVLKNAKKIGAVPFIRKPKHLTGGNERLNMLFVASLFNAKNGLDDLVLDEEEEEKVAREKAKLDEKDGDPRMERAFKNFINSLGIKDVRINSLFDDLYDGVIFLKVIEKVGGPKSVPWNIVETKLKKKGRKYIF
jgi:plastin-1